MMAMDTPIDTEMQVISNTDEQEFYEEEEGDYEDDYIDEEDKKEFGIYQCLPVDDQEPDWSTEEPLSVEEYLRRVRYEARHLPDVVTSDIDPAIRNTTPSKSYNSTVVDCPPEYKPSIRWLREFLQKFALLRKQLAKEHQLITGQIEGLPVRVTNPAALPASAQEALQRLSINPPSSAMPELLEIRGADQLTIVRRLHSTIQRTIENTASIDGDKKQISREDASSIYALSLRIEQPLHGDVCAAYRRLLKWCAQQRAETPHAQHDSLPHLNILITIAGAYFGQDEELSRIWEEEI